MEEGPRQRRLEPAEWAELVERIGDLLRSDSRIAAAWLFGSAARGEAARDIDLAILPRGDADGTDVAGSVAVTLEQTLPVGLPYDVRAVAPDAEPAFRFELIREGRMVADNDPNARMLFWIDAVRDYLDIAPFLARARRSLLERLARGA